MRRREFIALIGAATAAWPRASRAQQPSERMRRVGVLEETAEDDKERNSQFAKFRDALASFGWVEGRTVHIEHRFAAADAARYEQLAKELDRPATRGHPRSVDPRHRGAAAPDRD